MEEFISYYLRALQAEYKSLKPYLIKDEKIYKSCFMRNKKITLKKRELETRSALAILIQTGFELKQSKTTSPKKKVPKSEKQLNPFQIGKAVLKCYLHQYLALGNGKNIKIYQISNESMNTFY